MSKPSNGSSMESQRLSRVTNGKLTHLTFNQMEDQPTSDALPQTQDGGNSGEPKVDTLSTKRARSLKFKTKISTLMLNRETSKLEPEETISDNNGKSFTSTNTLNQRRENSTSSSVFSLKEISTLFHKWDQEDTLT